MFPFQVIAAQFIDKENFHRKKVEDAIWKEKNRLQNDEKLQKFYQAQNFGTMEEEPFKQLYSPHVNIQQKLKKSTSSKVK